MYVTRPLSRYYRSPEAQEERPPPGPGSGIIVIQDEEAEAEMTCCWGTCYTSQVYGFPFPQNRKLIVRYSTGAGENSQSHRDDVFFIPVVGQPLSSNRYYAVKADGRSKGNVWTCSKEEEQTTFCLCTFTHDVKPTPFNPSDIYQQVELSCKRDTNFYAKAVAPDGIPPQFIRRNGWRVYTSTPSNFSLGEALGVNAKLRAELPDIGTNVSIVGKWYCPFMFVREGERLKDQMKRSMFYEVSLHQFWEEVYACDNDANSDVVLVSVGVRRELGILGGVDVASRSKVASEGCVWFRGTGSSMGLSEVVWERMLWEEERGGYVGGEEVGRVERAAKFKGVGGWRTFKCYVLVERFEFKRMDGSLALSYEFKHTNKVRVAWE